jgi:hypothetical protein
VRAAEGPAYTFEMTPSLAGVWTLLSLGILGVAIAAVALLYLALGRQFSGGPAGFLLWPAALLITLPLHELVHALFVVLYGGRPRFGAGVKGGMPYLYVTDPGRRFGRNQFLEIALAPLVLIDLGALILLLLQPAWSWAAVAFVVNTSGAIGDLWVSGLLLRFPRWALVEDRKDGFAVWTPLGQDEAGLRRAAPRHHVPAPPWLGIWFFAACAIFAVLPFAAITLAAWTAPGSGTHTLGLGPLHVITVHQPGRGAAIQLNLLLMSALAAVLAAPVTVAWRRWRRPRRPR